MYDLCLVNPTVSALKSSDVDTFESCDEHLPKEVSALQPETRDRCLQVAVRPFSLPSDHPKPLLEGAGARTHSLGAAPPEVMKPSRHQRRHKHSPSNTRGTLERCFSTLETMYQSVAMPGLPRVPLAVVAPLRLDDQQQIEGTCLSYQPP